ncbi:hypothetical protein [Paenarthrobacter nicotinovorans]|uniref:hypothetical protein n=1 Tax=Paenarthrobacter nicotinovorans TaxID=29320 RepID=UPI00047A72FC|nr:hypothetical protein [Paenarthrobacter nicotinovorans]
MGIAFDEGAADALVSAANSTDEVLRAEGGFLCGAIEQAVQDFNGGYGRLFKDACGITGGTDGIYGYFDRRTESCKNQARIALGWVEQLTNAKT